MVRKATLQKPRVATLRKETAQVDQPTDPQADATEAAARVGQNLQQQPCPICGGTPVPGFSTIYHKPNCTQYQRG